MPGLPHRDLTNPVGQTGIIVLALDHTRPYLLPATYPYPLG
jgi:hypothetical protein